MLLLIKTFDYPHARYSSAYVEYIYVYVLCFSFSSFAAPNAPPSNIQGHNTSSTSIFVQRGNVSAADQNGVILSYTVTYKALPDGSPQTKVVSTLTTEVTLTGLNEYTNYSIAVFASTVKGGGLVSDPTFVVTAQDSKFHTSFFAVFAVFALFSHYLSSLCDRTQCFSS